MMLLATFICLHLAIVTSHPLLDNLESTQDGEQTAVEDDSLSMGTLHLTAPPHKRVPADYLVTDCMEVRSEEGTYYYKAGPDWEAGKACGIYLFTDPDRRVEIHFNYVDVPCQKGGLVSFVDGWELNGQFFPSPEDHPRPLDERFTEFCGQRKVKQVFESSQNAALIQYRMPMRGRGFSFSVRFLKNPSPCNVLLQSTGDMYTLRNYGKRSNCSLSALYPAVVRVAALSVGLAGASRSVEIETGIIHKCHKRSLGDYVQIGGSDGLDNTNLIVDDSLCGMDSKPESSGHVIFCGVTTVRLVSSGTFDNSVTIVLRPATEEDIVDASVVCGI